MKSLFDSISDALPGRDAGRLSPRRRRGARRVRAYFFASSGIALLAMLVAVGVSEAASRIAPDPVRQSASAFQFAQFANAFADSMSTRLEPLPVAPAPTLVAAAAPQAPVEQVDQAAPDAPADDNAGGQEAPKTQLAVKSRIEGVNVTFYDCKNQGFCGAMYNGRKVYQGAAACSWNLAIGTRFTIVGDPTRRIYACEDRGLLTNTWVDIFWNDPRDGYIWQSKVGRHGTIEIVSLP